MKEVILMSIRPEWLVKILNGEKTIEIRKTLAKGDEIWFYCAKAKPYLADFGDNEYPYKSGGICLDYDLHNIEGHGAEIFNGKIVAKCKVDKVGKIFFNLTHWRYEVGANGIDLSIASCLSTEQIKKYLGIEQRRKGKPKLQSNKGYAYHLKDLVIFDEPKELGEVSKEEYAVMPNGVFPSYEPLTKAPASFQYVWVKE